MVSINVQTRNASISIGDVTVIKTVTTSQTSKIAVSSTFQYNLTKTIQKHAKSYNNYRTHNNWLYTSKRAKMRKTMQTCFTLLYLHQLHAKLFE